MEGFITNCLGAYILTSADMLLVMFLCGYSVRRKKMPVILFILLLNFARAFLEYRLIDYDMVKNISYFCRYFLFLAMPFFFSDSSLTTDIYYVSLIKAADDVARVIWGKLLAILFGVDYLMSPVLLPFLAAHLSLILCKYLIAVWIRKRSSYALTEKTSVRDMLVIVLPALLYLIIRDIIRVTHVQPAELDMNTFLLTSSYGIVVVYSTIMSSSLFFMRRQEEMNSLELQIHKQQEHYEKMSSTIEEVNRTYHDLRHLLREIDSMETPAEIKEFTHEIIGNVRNYENIYKTGNVTFDMLLSDTQKICREKNIIFQFSGNGSEWNYVKNSDLAVLFGNAFSNAWEGADSCSTPEKRRVEIKLGRIQNMLFARISNGYEHPLNQSSGIFQTTKEKKEHHGYGIKSMDFIIHQYNGDMEVKTDNGIFALSIFIPLDEKAPNTPVLS